MNDKSLTRRDLFKSAAAAGVSMGALSAGTSITGQAAAQAQEAEKVPTKVLGSTGEKVPILLMGGELPFDPTFDRLLHRAFAEGLFYIDTAEKYANGKSHIGVGAFQEQVGRENLWITSKAGLWGGADASPPERFRQTLEKELPNLRTEQVNMFLMHGVEDPRCLDEEWIKMGQQMKKDGLTKFFGFSCHDGTVVELLNKAAKIGTAGIDAIMFKYSFAEYGDTELNKAIDACVKAGIGMMAMKAQDSVPEDQEEVQRFVSDNGFTLPQAKLKAVWADERISACVSGIVNTTILRENAAAAKSQTQLSMRDFQQLNQYAARTAHHRCKLCNHVCESQIDGDLKVSKALRYLMYDECYGQHEVAARLYHELRPEERAFEHLDLTAAEKACPRGIKIRERLEHARARLA